MDLPAKLNEFLTSKQGVPFKWGAHDCCLFAADWVRDVTGNDPYADLRGRYRSALGAARIIKANGGLAAATTAQLEKIGVKEIHPGFAQRGDIVLVERDGMQFLGICVGSAVAVTSNIGWSTTTANKLNVWRTV